MFKTILCPIDVSEPDIAPKALQVASDLAHQHGATIVLVAVVPEVPPMATTLTVADLHEQHEKSSRRALELLSTKLTVPKERIRFDVRSGNIHHELLQSIKDNNGDLVVMASHRPRLATYFIGSNAAHIVRHAPCSVLVVRD